MQIVNEADAVTLL